jgi:putative transposase
MAKRSVQFQRSCYYHIYNRGARRRSIFVDDTDFRAALQALKTYSVRYQIAIIAYCFMPNHYHWLVRQDGDIPIRYLAQYVFNGYVKAFHARHQTSGTLFEGTFKAKLVQHDAYLLHLCRYIHANPVRHGFAFAPDLWPYSNYQEWIGKRPGVLVDHDFVSAHFPDAERYAASVEDYLQGQHALPVDLGRYLDELEQV